MMRGFTMVAGMNRLHLSGARMTNDQQSKTIAWFGSLPPVLPTEMVGLWQGEGISSSHPLDGVLENCNGSAKGFMRILKPTPSCSSGRQAGLLPWSRLFCLSNLPCAWRPSAGHLSPGTGFRTCKRHAARGARRRWSNCGNLMARRQRLWSTTASRSPTTSNGSVTTRSLE